MNDTGAVTKEAKALNPEEGWAEVHMQQLSAWNHRRALTALLPPGKVLDQAMLDDITSKAQTWTPFIVVRQLLAEAGARSIGAGLIVTAAEVQEMQDQMRRNPQAPWLEPRREAAAGERGASAR